jgi:glycosyltransferase involved in cell wall biosynthesis
MTARGLRAIVMPNLPWLPQMRAHRPGEGPDPGRLSALMQARGITLVVKDPLEPPLNPWGRRHPFFAGIDPARALSVMLRERSADVVISVFETGALAFTLLRRLLLFRPPVLLWDVGAGDAWALRQRAVGFVLPRVDGLLALSRHQKDYVEGHYRMRAPVDLIGYYVDETFFHPDHAGDGGYVLSIGEDVARDYATLVAACAGQPGDVVLKTRQKPAIAEADAGRIRLLADRLSFGELRDLYARASMIVLPLRESINPSGITSLFEAMAMGKPVIASDVGIMREYVTHGETGLLVPPGDAAALRAAISHLAAHPEEGRRLGQAGRAMLERTLSMEAFADRFAAAIRAAVLR